MLSKEDNQLISQVGVGTPMGDFMRKFWVPALRTEALERGGDPIKLRLLGEDMVAFRGHDGRVGVLDERCPHRGVSLTLARNADCALTCIFHGWKIDVDGNVVDVPAEPAERRAAFQTRVKAKHYPAYERAGVVWIWMGGGVPAPLPNFPWMNLPAENVGSRIGIIHANWVNGLEGQLDSAHVGILHQDWVQVLPGQVSDLQRTQFDLAPRFEFDETPCGYREGAVRNSKEGGLYVRVREFVAPWYSFIPSMGGLDSGHLCTMSVPMDDEHSIQWDLFYNPVSPLVRRNSPDDGRNQNDLAEGMGDDRQSLGPEPRADAGEPELLRLSDPAPRRLCRGDGAGHLGGARQGAALVERYSDRARPALPGERGARPGGRRQGRGIDGDGAASCPRLQRGHRQGREVAGFAAIRSRTLRRLQGSGGIAHSLFSSWPAQAGHPRI